MNRKTYSRRADIPREILDQLNRGILETGTLAEGLAVDMAVLLEAIAPTITARYSFDPQIGFVGRMARAGEILWLGFGESRLKEWVAHPSDTVRGWAAYAIAAIPNLSVEERLERIRCLADDPHFGVREWAWLALRGSLSQNLKPALRLLAQWARDPSANIRRFASESTRPRGVWCVHLEPLKENPTLGLPLLEPLHADPSKYVQDSVANWLNDAAKSHPDWVRSLCEGWLQKSPSPFTRRIRQRALRSIGPG